MEDWRGAGERLRTWGHWGPHDAVGTLNYIDSAKIAAAARLVRKGAVFPLSAPLQARGPQGSSGHRRNPLHFMSVIGADLGLVARTSMGPLEGAQTRDFGPLRFNDDYIVTPLQASTHWDALAHVYYDGLLYNGIPADSVTSEGASRIGIEHAARRGVVGRGALLDVARFRGVEHLEAGTVIGPADLEEAMAAQAVSVGEGDILLVRTGWLGRYLRTGNASDWASDDSPGLSWECAAWLAERRIAALATDNSAAESGAAPNGTWLPLHMIAIRDMGMMLGEIWNLEKLSDDCAEDSVYDFLLIAQPLDIPGAVGSPLNPIAIK